ncbi:uncharacterized protein RCO7_15139 [Rhynchosporium graminicola]|uniref:Uncharacterized protein n=1 Tax=Rhynchosporium graminicola TaxID=2792576 RepID=A0A1E1LLT5_9HELO|nr:uncharacterized protein RCO7_15139 [Rhynchosporium commune]
MEAGSGERLSHLSGILDPKSNAGAISEPILPSGDCGGQGTEPLDVSFIAIDFDSEYSNYSPKTGSIRIRELGVSMLDTRNLRS